MNPSDFLLLSLCVAFIATVIYMALENETDRPK